jgi:RNA polymerase sigma-70 factor (ECF subfamily)
VRSTAEDDRRLIARIVDKDLRAFEELYRNYHPRLTRFLGSFTRRPEVAEEVLNETMIVVWSKPEKYNGASKVSTWIFAIAYRKALKALRSQDEPMEEIHEDLRVSPDPGPEQLLGQRQVQQALLGAMSRLSADHRAVVDLTYFHEFGYREIAEVLGCPVDTVKTRMFHARRRLKTMLAGPQADWL